MSIDQQAGDAPTTGHVWDDDLADFTNQPPKWWMLGLTASAIWVCVYWLMYPSVPVATHGTFWEGIGLPGSGKWTAIKEMEADKSVIDEVRNQYENKIKGMTPAAILADQDLTEYVTRSGKVLFGDNCAACHGTNGVGATNSNPKAALKDRGYMAPVLNDDDWLYGGTIDDIHATIAGGRQGMMPAHKDMLSESELDTLANAVAQGKPTSTPLFTEKGCVACHGADGKGMQAMGSANLTDGVWRFDSSIEGIKQTIKYGVNSGDPLTRVAVMPAFQGGKLSDDEIKKLAVYVYKFGGGVAAAPAAPAAPAEAAPAK